ncbi:MAG: DUF4382 domain-containing protein [Elainellaceae cyanobacterium]
MKKHLLVIASIVAIAPGFLYACSSPEPEADAPAESQTETAATDESADGGEGTLELRANGEDFVRQGFVTKDGWQVSFDHIYVNLADVTAYQTDPPYDPDTEGELKANTEVGLDEPQTVDLAEGDETAEPILISEVMAPAGRYNALSWEMVPADSGPAEGYTLVMMGTAEKDGRAVDFTIKTDQPYAYTCGAFVGDERKGILESGDTADLEATFHFDHIFGDGEAPADDPINTGAVGFEPFAAIAQDGQLDADMAALEQQLPQEDYATLKDTMAGLAHVGEGHCKESMPESA